MYLLYRGEDLNALSYYMLAGRNSTEKLYEAELNVGNGIMLLRMFYLQNIYYAWNVMTP